MLVSIFIIDYSFCKKNLNRITRGREQIVNLIFVRMMDELGYDLELTYKKKGSKIGNCNLNLTR